MHFFGRFAALAGLLAALPLTSDGREPRFELVRRIENPHPNDRDDFGRSLVARTDRLVVGAQNDDTGETGSGSAYIFDFSGDLVASLANPEAAQFANFGGRALATSGSTLLIGAPGSDSGANNAGAVYLYNIEDGEYRDTIRSPEVLENSRFATNAAATPEGFLIYDRELGEAVVRHFAESGGEISVVRNPHPEVVSGIGTLGLLSIDDSMFFVSGGSRRELRDDGQVDPGTAHSWIMSFDGEVLHEIANPSGDFDSTFGLNAALVQDRIVVSANNEEVILGETVNVESGAVYLYDFEGQLVRSIPNPDAEEAGRFGISLASIGEDLFAVGARSSSRMVEGGGAVYVYDSDGELLQTIDNPVPEEHADFGVSLAFSDGNLFVGAAGAIGPVDDGGYGRPGAVYQFQLTLPPLAADFNGDGTVDLSDFVILKDHFNSVGAKPEQGDADGDGVVDLGDFAILKDEFGESNAVPEPSGAALAAAAAIVAAAVRGIASARSLGFRLHSREITLD